MIFKDRADAGRRLAGKLLNCKGKAVVVLAIPRGGVPVGREIARRLGASLGVLVVRKLGAPFDPEFGFGAIAPGGVRVIDEAAVDQLKISEAEIAEVECRERQELERRIQKYRGQNALAKIKGKTVILVDDGLATGVTARAAAAAVLSKNPQKLIVALPVCARDAMSDLRSRLRQGRDEVVCLSTPDNFEAVGLWYQDFPQLTDEEIQAWLKEAKKRQ